MAEIFYGAPFLLIVSCAWALLPLRGRRVRVGTLLALIVSAVCFVVYWGSGSYSPGVAAVLAPAALLAAFRLLLELFEVLGARESRRAAGDCAATDSRNV